MLKLIISIITRIIIKTIKIKIKIIIIIIIILLIISE